MRDDAGSIPGDRRRIRVGGMRHIDADEDERPEQYYDERAARGLS